MGTKFLIKPFSFQVMAKPIGSHCNLNCTYCYYLEKAKLYKGNQVSMDEKLLENYIRQYVSVQQVPVVNFVWQGGEPCLLGIDFFKKAIELQNKYAQGKRIENSIQTNGSLLDESWAKFFKEHNILVGISIDGPEEIHDLHRSFKNNSPSFMHVMKGIELLHKYEVDFNTLTVVNRDNSRFPLEIYHFLKKIGSGYIQFIPIVERTYTGNNSHILSLVEPGEREAAITKWSVSPEDYGTFLIKIFDEWVTNDVGRYFIQQFDATLANWIGANSGICEFSETCGDALIIELNGDVYSCDHYVYPEYKLGNIADKSLFTMVQSDQQTKFGNDKLNNLPPDCIECEYRFACHGGCPKHRFLEASDNTSRLNYLCKAYKMFYSHVHPYMQFMGDELTAKRSPANVMDWARTISDNQAV